MRELPTLASLTSARMHATPHAVAIIDGTSRISYRELDQRCAELAGALVAAGVGRGDLVGVCLPRTWELVAAILATHRVGAGYLPLDPGYPPERLRLMVIDSTPRAFLADAVTASILPADAIRIDEVTGTQSNRYDDPTPDDIAYVIYTSGSTGKPKGAVLEHRNVVALLDWVHAEFSAEDLRGVLFSTSVCFDLSVFEIFGPLTAGGSLVVAPNALALPELPAREEVTLLNTVPPVTAALLDAQGLPASVRIVVHSGDTTTRALANDVYAVPTVEKLYNLYGPTEAVVWQTGSLVARDATEEPPIGTPFPGVAAHVLDADGLPASTGELYLSGAQVGRGYLNRPELTAELFVHRPDLAPGPLYRTGDVVSRDAAGVLRFCGRTDSQVKVRGYRVELGEIEAALTRHPQVRAAMVIVTDAGQLWAYAQVGAIASADADGLLHGPTIDTMRRELLNQLCAELPDYMVPSAIGFLPALPLSQTGKRDRSRLPRLASATTGRVPAQGAEELVAQTWREVLQHTDIPADVPFAALGGDSLRAAGVVGRLRQRGMRITVADFLAHQTVEALARQLRPESAPPEIAAGGDVAPPTANQTEMWLGDQLGSAALWNVATLVDVTGPMDEPALQSALDSLVERHVALRTAMPDASTRIRQQPYAVPLQSVDASDQAVHDAARTPIDVTTGRMVTATLVRIDANHAQLVLTIHHLATDGLSTAPLLADLAALYHAHRSGTPLPDPPRVSFDDAAHWLQQSTKPESRQRFPGRPAWASPGGRGYAGHGPWDGARVECPLPAEAMAHLRGYVEDGATTLAAVLTAGIALQLHRETGADDLLVNLPVSTRRHPDLEDVVGPLHDMTCIRSDLTDDPTFAELVGRIGSQIGADLELGGISWRDIAADEQRWIRPPMLMLAMQPAPQPIEHGANTWTFVRELDTGGARRDLTLLVESDLAEPRITVEYARDRYTEADARRTIDQILAIAVNGAQHPSARVGELTALSHADQAVLRDYSGADRVRPATAPTVQRLLNAAARWPDAVAVECPRVGEVTYAQLVAGAATMSRQIRGCGGDAPIAIAAGRGAKTIAAMLGCWLAGCAYLPIDPAHPPERIRHYLTDSAVQLAIVDQDIDAPLAPLRLHDLLSDTPSDWSGEVTTPAGGSSAYRLYTSGSTGAPKGVTVSHDNLASLLDAFADRLPMRADDVVAHVTTLSFDISEVEVWSPLLVGATVKVIDEETVRDGFALAAKLRGVTFAQMTPTGWQILLAAGWTGDPALRALAGGERVSPTLASAMLARTKEFWNGYGPTEATIYAALHQVGETDTTVPIGPPVGNCVLHVLDAEGRLVPPGVVGEICIGGFGVAAGYHNRPELTARSFVELPELPHGTATDRFYRTGDLGRWTESGLLECLGRNDDQVKVHGIRIELGEVEAALTSVSGVQSAAVLADDSTGATRLVGYVVLDPNTDTEAVSDRLRDLLPIGYLPEAWVELPALPLTSSGKVDRTALPAVSHIVSSFAAPDTDVEKLVADIWTEVLAVDRVGREDSFISLGGHSLLATKVTALLREDLELTVPVRLLFQHPKLRDFATAVSQLLLEDVHV